MNEMRTTGNIVTDHFTDASKMVGIGSGAKRGVKDYYLSRLGVRSQMFGGFHDAGYPGQYTLDAENIRIYKGARFWTTWAAKN